MTFALPAGPRPSPRRQIFIGTGIVVAIATMIIGGMLSLWLRFRAAAPTRASSDGLKQIKDWLPADIKIPEVVTNTGLITFAVACLIAQWAVYSARRRDHSHVVAALALNLLMGVAIINAIVATFTQMGIGVGDGAYQSMFFALVGTLLVLVAGGIGFTVAAMFKSIGGRATNSDLMSAHALYWYFLAAAYTAVWFVVFVQK